MPVVRPQKLARLAAALGLLAATDVQESLRALNRRLQMTSGLRTLGVTEAMLDTVIAGALADHSSTTNPKPVSASEYRAVLMKTMI